MSNLATPGCVKPKIHQKAARKSQNANLKHSKTARRLEKRSAVAICPAVVWFGFGISLLTKNQSGGSQFFVSKLQTRCFGSEYFSWLKFFAVRRKRYSILLLHGRIIIYSNIIYHCHQTLKKCRRPTARCLRSLDFCCIFIPTCSKSHGFPTTLTNVCAFVLVVCSTVKQESYHESCAQMGHIKPL